MVGSVEPIVTKPNCLTNELYYYSIATRCNLRRFISHQSKGFNMAILTTEIKEFIKKQKLGFVATVCPDGTPNLSPKGTTTVWDDDHLVFADIHSPGTVNNLLHNPSIEINIVDI